MRTQRCRHPKRGEIWVHVDDWEKAPRIWAVQCRENGRLRYLTAERVVIVPGVCAETRQFSRDGAGPAPHAVITILASGVIVGICCDRRQIRIMPLHSDVRHVCARLIVPD